MEGRRLADAPGVDVPEDGLDREQVVAVEGLQHRLEDLHVVAVDVLPPDSVDPVDVLRKRGVD